MYKITFYKCFFKRIFANTNRRNNKKNQTMKNIHHYKFYPRNASLGLNLLILTVLFFIPCNKSFAGEKLNFNNNWSYRIGDNPQAQKGWKDITLPHAFNESEAFRVSIAELTDTVVWYRKTFRLPSTMKGKKVFVEFEGIRQAGDFYLNGHKLGLHENGVMAVGFDLSPYLLCGKPNTMSVRIDNSWKYKEQSTGTSFQWNNNNFNANYGGIPKNVWLHICDKVYQTLPIYSNLGTTGVYIYASDFNIPERKAIIHAESQVKNETPDVQTINYEVQINDPDGKTIKTFSSKETVCLQPGEMHIVKANTLVEGLHFWSWGYGYLYTVKTRLIVNGKCIDEVKTRTGFRQTRFKDGKIWLNERVIQMKGFAQRTSNEWPSVGLSVPAWLSDYSNNLMVKCNANLVRWMHVTPWKQDVESCDRVGLIQAMPAGDAEKDCNGRQWILRTNLMRDAIIYNRNNPSILFYESGNESVSREHMLEMIAIRDLYDPHGGRAMGSREMLNIREAEYGGEMLYINKSAHTPMWAMEYCRDEGLRKYWDELSYPYHKEGEGPLYRNADASDYNHNQDAFAIECIRRWYDYWRERPGTGTRVSSGGVKIIFSESNTHCRGAENYRRSGSVDAMRIEKDAFFAHQVMWDGWVNTEKPHTYIIGHWNYRSEIVKDIFVVSNSPKVELFLNGHSLGYGNQSYNFLYTFKNVKWEAGKLEAVSYNKQGKEESRYQIETAGKPAKIRLSLIQSPNGTYADGADMVLLQAEVTDYQGRRCPLSNDTLRFSINGPAEWRGGIAQGKDNFILSKELPVECGINRALIRTLTKAGKVTIKVSSMKGNRDGYSLEPTEISFNTTAVKDIDHHIPGEQLPGLLTRGETPSGISYTEDMQSIQIAEAVASANSDKTFLSYDDNELSEWKNDGKSPAWITYRFKEPSNVDDICIKFTGWRMRSYPIEIYADKKLIWSGDTEKSLGYLHFPIPSTLAKEITFRLKGSTTEKDAFGQIVEVAQPVAGELDLFKAKGSSAANHELRIVEVEFLQKVK